MAFLLARHGVLLNYVEDEDAMEEGNQEPRLVIADDDLREELRRINSNSRLSEFYLSLARDLDVMEPKTPDEVYKTHLVDGRAPAGPAVDSARQNLASSFVNAFVNAGFGNDTLMTVVADADASDSVHWIFKNKDHGKTSATASLGLITLWDVEGGLPQIDKYLYSRENHVVAGALLAVGITNTGVQDENDPAYALLCESVMHADPNVAIGAIMGLGLAYAGTQKAVVQELLLPLVTDPEVKIEVAGFAALSLGLVFVSTCHGDSAEAIIQALMLRGELELSSPFQSSWHWG
jgi:26S proteasome regulatory subunit N1